MASTKTLVTAATAAGTAIVDVTSNNPCTLIGWGFAGTDAVPIQISYNGTDYVDCYKDGIAVTITATNNPVTVYGPGKFRINKGITAGTVGVAKAVEP